MNTPFTMFKAIETRHFFFLMDAFNSTVFTYILLAGVSYSLIGFSGIITCTRFQIQSSMKILFKHKLTHLSVANRDLFTKC